MPLSQQMKPLPTEYPPRPTPGEVWYAHHEFYDNARAFEPGTAATARAERVPADLTTMSQIPPTTSGRGEFDIKKADDWFWNIFAVLAILALGALLIMPPAHAEDFAYMNETGWNANPIYQSHNLTSSDALTGPTYDQCNSFCLGISQGYAGGWHIIEYAMYPYSAGADGNRGTNWTQPSNFMTSTTTKYYGIGCYCSNMPYMTDWPLWKVSYRSDISPIPVEASFVVNQSNYRIPPTTAGFFDTSVGTNLQTWEWYSTDSTGRYTFSSNDRWPIWYNMTHPGSYYVYLIVNDGMDDESFADYTFTVLGENVTPVPTILPNMTVNITPAPTVTIQTIATFANLTAYNTTSVRIEIEGYFGNLTGPFLDWSDDMAQGITDMADALFYLPNYSVLAVTNILAIITDIGQQTLQQMSTAVNLILQLARIAANTIPADWQLLMVYSLTLETVYLLMRGDT